MAMEASQSQRSPSNASSSSSLGSQGNKEQSDSGEHSPLLGSTPKDGVKGSAPSSILTSTKDNEQTVISQPEYPSPTYTGLPDLPPSRPLILQHPHGMDGAGHDENSMSWLYDFYPNALGNSPKDDFYVEQTSGTPISHQVEIGPDQRPAMYIRSQEKYIVTLGAPISIAQRMNDDTLTYLNKGQFYNVMVSANTRMSLPQRVKTVLALTFLDEPDRRVEFNHWQYWYNLQANPNQRAFDIDRKNCENILGKVNDLAYNAASFVWSPEVGAKIVLRINCLSTEFSSQKGVKGIPLFLVADTYDEVESEGAEPVHRAFCRIKIFRDKGAERKNKDETRSVERRLQKVMKEQSGGGLESDAGVSSMFHPPSKETTLTPTSTFIPKMFFFTPQQTKALSPGHASLAPVMRGDASLINSEPWASGSRPVASSQKGTHRWKSGAVGVARHHQVACPQDYPSFKTEARSSNFLANMRERETKRTFTKALRQAKEDLGALEVEEEEETPPKKAPKIPSQQMTTVYVRKKEETIYNALLLDSLTVHDLKLQIAKKYNVPADMIKEVLKRTKKGLLVRFDDDMVSHFSDEDDFIIDLTFDNQKGFFNLLLIY